MRSLAANLPADIPVETIVLLNGADDAVSARVRQVAGITVLTADVNMGFGEGCNYAARHARGEFLVFLNDDASVEPGWLEELLGAADRDLDAGAVGSLILSPDGTLRESGSAISCDGITTPIGRGEMTDGSRFSFARRVDFCSGCSLLVRRWAWERLGGFCERYYPAYFEDADFCVALRALGLHVIVAPASRVRHQEAATATRDFRDFLIAHHRPTFIARHEAWLRESAVPLELTGVGAAMLWASGGPRRLLIIDDRLPNPRSGSGYGRMWQTVQELAASNYALTFCACENNPRLRPELERAGVEVVGRPLEDHLAEPDRLYDVVLISRPYPFRRFASVVRDRQPQAALVYDAEALFHRRLLRQATYDPDPAIQQEAADVRTMEVAIAGECDDAVCVSDEEAQFFRQHGTPHRVTIVRPLLPARLSGASFRDRSGAVLIAGWLGGPRSPNADGLNWFVREVLPLVVARIPWFRLRVTGADPPPAIASLADQSVTFVGEIENLATVYNATRVAISPVRFGAGVKMKVLEAISFGVPVVATTLGAAGAHDAEPGAVRIADDPAGFAGAVADLLLNREQWEPSRRAAARTAERWAAPAGPRWADVLERAQLCRSTAAVATRVARSFGAPHAGSSSNRS
jgi:GT2 family glycosyltransferase